jgi:hypothetical protein
MAMDAAEAWRKCLTDWPADVARRGVLVTAYGEQIPFDSFTVSPEMLLVERRTPDVVGARAVLIAFEHIQSVKIVDIIKPKSFAPLGFVTPVKK